MKTQDKDDLVLEILNEPWFINLSLDEYTGVYEVDDSSNHTGIYSYTDYAWLHSGQYNYVTISRPITFLKRKTLHTYKYQQATIKPIKYQLQRPAILRI